MQRAFRVIRWFLSLVVVTMAAIVLIPSLLGSLVVILLAFVVFDMLRRGYRSRVRTLNSSLRAVCDREGTIQNVAVAFSRSGPLRDPCKEFAKRLTVGEDAVAAAMASGVPLQLSTAVALTSPTSAGEVARRDRLGSANATSTRLHDLASFDTLGTPVHGQFLYLAITASITCLVIAFTGTFIVPTLLQIFEEFDLSLPMMWVYDAAPMVWLLVAFGMATLAGILLINRARWIGIPLPKWIPVTSAMAERRAETLEGLADGIDAGWPLGRTMALGHSIAASGMERKEIERAMRFVQQGNDPIESMRRVGWIDQEEAAWLSGAAPERMSELFRGFAEQSIRDARERVRWIMAFLFPTLVVSLGIIVLLYALAFFGALSRLTYGLT